MKNLLAILVISSLAIFQSCSTQNPNDPQTLNLELTGSYTLEYLEGTNIDEGFPDKKPTLTLESISKNSPETPAVTRCSAHSPPNKTKSHSAA